MRERLRLPTQLVVAGIAVAGLAFGLERFVGDALPLPIRPLWIAGPLVLLGVALGILRLVLTAEE